MEDENNGKIVDQKPTRSGSQRRVSVSPKTQAVLTSCGLDGHVNGWHFMYSATNSRVAKNSASTNEEIESFVDYCDFCKNSFLNLPVLLIPVSPSIYLCQFCPFVVHDDCYFKLTDSVIHNCRKLYYGEDMIVEGINDNNNNNNNNNNNENNNNNNDSEEIPREEEKEKAEPSKTSPIPNAIEHHWLESNYIGQVSPSASSAIASSSSCIVCHKSVAIASTAYICSWCQRLAHKDCHDKFIAKRGPVMVEKQELFECDMGKHRNIIVPPNCVKMVLNPITRERSIKVIQKEGNCSLVSPLLVFVNKKSGGQQGLSLLKKLRRILNPVQIIDLAQGGPDPGLELFHKVRNLRILVCGGDGTVGWILMALDKLKEKMVGFPSPPIAIMPLGTGNDLARHLGWGGGFTNTSINELHQELQHIANAKETLLDRWKIEITSAATKETRTLVMNNYFSIGLDAKIALDFHLKREANPEKFQSRIGNKISYGLIGGKEMLTPNSISLAQDITVSIPGKPVNSGMSLPNDTSGLVVLNISSYAAGTDLWGSKQEAKFKMQSAEDGVLEVLGIDSSFHLAAISARLASARRLLQTNDLIITLQNPLPVQVDGEPWLQEPCEIHISLLNQAPMLIGNFPSTDNNINNNNNGPLNRNNQIREGGFLDLSSLKFTSIFEK